MFRRTLQIGLTASLIVLGIVVAARAAEPAVRPVLYPAHDVAEVSRNATLPGETTTTTSEPPATTAPTSEPPATTAPTAPTSEPPATTAPTSEPPATTAPTTTTDVPPEEPVDGNPAIDEAAVLGAEYGWFERGERVRELQRLLDLSADGVYGAATRAAHLAENEARGLATGGIPPVPTTTTTTTTAPPSTTAVPEEVPVETTTTVPDASSGETTTTTTAAPTTTAPSVFGGMGAEIVAQLLGQPCIADGDLSDCPPNVVELVAGLTG